MGTYDRQIYLPSPLESGWGAVLDANFSRLADLAYNVKAYGAVGDNSADDFAAIQAAHDTALAAGGGDVFLPQTTFKIASGLAISPKVRLVGQPGSVLNYTGAGVAVTIQQPALAPIYESPRVENVRILNGGTGTAGLLVEANNPTTRTNPAARGLLRNVQVNGFSGAGIDLRFAIGMTLLNCYSLSNQDGLLIRDQSNATQVIGGAYRQNSRSGIHVDTTAISITDFYSSPTTVLESNTQYGLLIDGTNTLLNATIGGHYEANPTRAIYVNAGAAATGLQFASFLGAHIAMPNGAADVGIEIVNCAQVGLLWLSWSALPQITLGSGTRDVFGFGVPSGTVINDTGQRNNIGKADAVGNNVGGINFSGLWKGKRLAAAGTNLAATDIALSAGWGTTAAVTLLNNSSDGRFRMSIVSSGTGQAANPTVTLTFKDGTWGGAPHGVVSRGDIAAPVAGDFRKTAQTATTWTITFNDTPVAGNTYILDGMALGQ